MLSRLRQSARDRAGRRCEYCRFHENDLPLWPFHLDHIVAEQHAGKNQLDNVAWACQRCNAHKGTNLAAIDPDSTQVTRLFHPRRDKWDKHFAIRNDRIAGLSVLGRATVWLLQMNSETRVELRRELIATGSWPPGP
jgi:hypothetical protein